MNKYNPERRRITNRYFQNFKEKKEISPGFNERDLDDSVSYTVRNVKTLAVTEDL